MFEILNYIFSVGINISHIIGYIASILAFLFIYKNWEYIKHEKILTLIILFLVYGFILACFSKYKKSGFEEMFNYLASWIFPFVLGYSVGDKNNKEKIIKVYIITFAILLIFSILSYYGLFFESIAGRYLSFKGKVLKAFMWHISCGAICMLTFCFTFIHLILKPSLSNNQKLFLSAISILSLVSLFLTGSRTYYVAGTTTIFLILVFCIYKRKNFIRPITILGISALIIIGLYSFNPFMQKRIQNTDIKHEGSITDRILAYKVCYKILQEKPIFGCGPKQSVKHPVFIELSKTTTAIHLHSMYLNIVSDFGFVGFILFCCMIFYILKSLLLKYKEEDSLLALCMFFAWISVLLGENFDTNLRGPKVAMDYFWLTGLILSNISFKGFYLKKTNQ